MRAKRLFYSRVQHISRFSSGGSNQPDMPSAFPCFSPAISALIRGRWLSSSLLLLGQYLSLDIFSWVQYVFKRVFIYRLYTDLKQNMYIKRFLYIDKATEKVKDFVSEALFQPKNGKNRGIRGLF
jgi:hypothetical protein